MPYHTPGKQTLCFKYLLPATLFVLLSGLYVTGCTNDPLVDTPTPETEDEISLELSIEIPSVNKPVTRAMSTEDEGTIEKIDVLVFRVEGSTETFAYRTHNSSQPATEDNCVKFMVSLKKSEATESYRLVMLANLRDEADTALETIQEGDAKEQVLAAITFTQDAPWPTGSDQVRLIPMWGETTEHAIINRSTTLQSFGGNIPMLRALARVDVSLQLGEGSEIPGFEISRIKVCNAHTTHAAVPGSGSGFSIQNQKVTSPTIVSDERIDPPWYTR